MSESAPTCVTVAVNRPLPRLYSYLPDLPARPDLTGRRVLVDFSGSREVAVVTGLGPPPAGAKLKTAQILDPQPLFGPDLRHLLSCASDYYHYALGQCYYTALPALLREGKAASYAQIPGLELTPVQDPKKISAIKSQEQLQILAILAQGAVRRLELRERGISAASENALLKKGLVRKIDLHQDGVPWQSLTGPLTRESGPELNLWQSQAVRSVTACNGYGCFLLQGVTGSGKTEVYLRIIEETLQRGRCALVLVPEIALTPQTFERFYRRFNVPIASLHSALSDRERLDAYLDMQSGRAGILIGTRSALFTPLPNLGLIVIDEEHDSSFKQGDGLRYHAREMCLWRARYCNCPVVLGSATPALESLYRVKQGLYTPLELPKRATGASLPGAELIDLRQEPFTDGLYCGIGQSLERRIGEETAQGNQVVLFLNRRGYARHLICHGCAQILSCPNCDNPLTVHRAEGLLKCHICEYRRPLPARCPGCGSAELLESGFGTEQVERFVRLRYPDAGVVRIDRDTVKDRRDLEESLKSVRQGRSLILLGTQMLAKGHDFPGVTLVGILDVDGSLISDDFRAQESCAQLITQVAGRAGRASRPGTVLLQSHHPEHPLLQQLLNPQAGYPQVAETLLRARLRLNLPPYSCQAYVLCNAPRREDAFLALRELRAGLYARFASNHRLYIGPTLPDKMEKRQNRYHYHLLLSAPARTELDELLAAAQESCLRQGTRSSVRFALEVDPQENC